MRGVLTAASPLELAVSEFVSFAGWLPRDHGAVSHGIAARLHRICELVAAERARGITRQALLPALAPVRERCAQSPLVAGMQRGADALDVEAITAALLAPAMAGRSGTLAGAVEQFVRDGPLAQHLRAERLEQAVWLATALRQHGRAPRILCLDGGASVDLGATASLLASQPVTLILRHDTPAALAAALTTMPVDTGRITGVVGGFDATLPTLTATGPFDVVLGGALLDRLGSRRRRARLRVVMTRLLAPGGRLRFSAARRGSAHREFVEHIGDWLVRTHTAPDLARLMREACGDLPHACRITHDASGVAYRVGLDRRD